MKNTWFKTDEKQFCSKISEEKFKYAEVVEMTPTSFLVRKGLLEWSDYTKEDLITYLETYGYNSFEEVKVIYKEDWKQIVLECAFEISDDFDGDIFGTEKEALDYLLKTEEINFKNYFKS